MAATNKADAAEEVITHRRELVAPLRLRRLSARAIAADLEKAGCVNPNSGQPWNYVTILNDCKALIEEWRERAKVEVDERVAIIIAEYDHLRDLAHAAGNLELVLKITKEERALLGLDAASKVDLTSDGKPLQAVVYLPAKESAE